MKGIRREKKGRALHVYLASTHGRKDLIFLSGGSEPLEHLEGYRVEVGPADEKYELEEELESR